MNEARNNILERLRRNRVPAAVATHRPTPPHFASLEARVERFSERQQAVRGEVHRLPDGNWLDWLRRELPKRRLNQVLVGSDHSRSLPGLAALPALTLHVYREPIENWKTRLFNDIQVAITRCRAGIAETGSLVLWPDAQAPRLMSLVPPVHIALLEAAQLHDSFGALIEAQAWAQGMPSNALLISGPSKTADIEQTLAYGIHGPKQLITLILG